MSLASVLVDTRGWRCSSFVPGLLSLVGRRGMFGVLIAVVVAAGASGRNDLPGNCRQVSSDLVECRGYVTRVPEVYRLYPSRVPYWTE